MSSVAFDIVSPETPTGSLAPTFRSRDGTLVLLLSRPTSRCWLQSPGERATPQRLLLRLFRSLQYLTKGSYTKILLLEAETETEGSRLATTKRGWRQWSGRYLLNRDQFLPIISPSSTSGRHWGRATLEESNQRVASWPAVQPQGDRRRFWALSSFKEPEEGV